MIQEPGGLRCGSARYCAVRAAPSVFAIKSAGMGAGGVLSAAGMGLLLASAVTAQPNPDFARDIQPLLQARCVSCHGSRVAMRHLRLDRRADALRGGESGVPAIVPGNSAQSLLVRYVSGLDPNVVMPPSGPRLTPEQIALLRTWIDSGAEWPGESPDPAPSARSGHWAFQPVRRPAVPTIAERLGSEIPIDAFVLQKLAQRDWSPAPPAAPGALRRRIYADLIGLPPTLEEQARPLDTPEAVDALVDELLARPAYGERWARHWLDLVRYRRNQRLRARRHQAVRLALPRLRHPRLQRRQAVRPLRPRAARRRRAAGRDRGDVHRHSATTGWVPGTTSRPIRQRTASTSSTTSSAPRRRSSSA